MKTKKQINDITGIIKDVWIRNPNLRVCQLIQNMFGTDDIYMVEDKMLIKKLKEYYGLSKKS